MTTFLRHVSTIYANLTALYSIGQSVQGRELWVMVVSSSPYEHMIGKKEARNKATRFMLAIFCGGKKIREIEIHELFSSIRDDKNSWNTHE